MKSNNRYGRVFVLFVVLGDICFVVWICLSQFVQWRADHGDGQHLLYKSFKPSENIS